MPGGESWNVLRRPTSGAKPVTATTASLEGCSCAEGEEAHLVERNGGDLAELLPPALKLRWIDTLVNVNGIPRTPSMRNGKARFWNAAGIFAGSRSNPASMLNHSSRVGLSSAMSSRSPLKKMF
jgi:hypothetical protein